MGATTAALLLAATGTSLASVRFKARSDGDRSVFDSAQSTRDAPSGGGQAMPPTAGGPGEPVAPGGPGPVLPGPLAPGQVPAPGDPATTTGPPTSSTGQATPTPAGGQPGPSPRAPTVQDGVVGGPDLVSPSDPVGGPTPTRLTNRTAPTVACPSDSGTGALPHRTGPLQAVDFVLPWPGLGPLLLAPQVSATREPGAAVRVLSASLGSDVVSGSGLALAGPADLDYTLSTGDETAQGSVRFATPGLPAILERQACRDRSFALYDVERASLGDSPLRIIGAVAPTATITLADDGGTARFTASTAGVHQVLLVTASDAGAAGPVLRITVHVS